MPKNLLGHDICVFEHVIIPKSQDAHSQLVEAHRPELVVFRLGMIGVLAAVKFGA
jgi:hypothetical protein